MTGESPCSLRYYYVSLETGGPRLSDPSLFRVRVPFFISYVSFLGKSHLIPYPSPTNPFLFSLPRSTLLPSFPIYLYPRNPPDLTSTESSLPSLGYVTGGDVVRKNMVDRQNSFVTSMLSVHVSLPPNPQLLKTIAQ